MPDGLAVENPFEVVYAISGPGVAQYGRRAGRSASKRSAVSSVHEHDLAARGLRASAGDHEATRATRVLACWRLRALPARRRALPAALSSKTGVPPTCGDVFDVSTRFVEASADAYLSPGCVGYLLGGHLVHANAAPGLAISEPGGDMAFRGLFFTEAQEHLDTFAVDLHETGPSGGDVHWRGAATGQSRASFEGLIQIDPGAQQTHTYLQIHTMMLSPKTRLDAIPSVLVSADDVSASHGGTVGELDEAVIFYMQTRGLDRPDRGEADRGGLFEPVLGQARRRRSLRKSWCAASIAIPSWPAAPSDDIEAYATAR